MENKYVWDKIYSENNFNISVRMIENLLKNRQLLYSYYPIVRLLEKNKLKINKSIELGAGTGQMSLILKKLGLVKEVYLVDIEKSALEIAKRLFAKFNEKCTIIHSDMFKLKYKKDEFDLCFSGGLIEHFKGKQQDEVIQIHANLAKYIIYQFPFNSHTYWLIRCIISAKNKGKWPFGYEKPISKARTKILMKRNNIKILDEDFHYVLPAVACRLKKVPNKALFSPKNIPFFKMDYAVLCKKIN